MKWRAPIGRAPPTLKMFTFEFQIYPDITFLGQHLYTQSYWLIARIYFDLTIHDCYVCNDARPNLPLIL